MTEISKTRKELEEQAYIDKYGEGYLKGFNLGVQLAQKEFLDFLESLHPWSVPNKVHDKIEELKRTLEVKAWRM